MSIHDVIIENILKIEVALHHACVRLQARTDDEALHDLRIQLRRLRSVLRPLRGMDSAQRLEQASTQLGKLTTAVRDLEVLAAELEGKGFAESAIARRKALARAYAGLLRSRALARLLAGLDKGPGSLRLEWMSEDARKLRKQVARRVEKQVDRLAEALGDPDLDPHKLRVLAKRTRYMIEAYPQQSKVAPEAIDALKTVQSSLGAWHDRYQWCCTAESEPDLQPLRPQWRSEAATALREAEAATIHLKKSLKIGHVDLPPLPPRVGASASPVP